MHLFHDKRSSKGTVKYFMDCTLSMTSFSFKVSGTSGRLILGVGL